MTLACVHVVGQAAVSFFQHDQLQRLIEEMVAYFQNLKPYEKEIYQRYIDDYCPFYAVSSIWNALAAFFVIIGALFTAQPFPMMAEYPFPVDYEPVKSVIYLQHSYVAVQCVSTLSSNMIAALLILFAAGRFEILMVDLRAAVTVDRLKSCMEQCQLARKYAEDVIEGVQYIAIITLIISSGNLVLSGLNVIGRQPIMVKIQSIFLAGSALIEVYMCAWPADALMEVSETAAESVYKASWYNQDLKVQKTVLLMLVPQKPIVISLRFVMVALSLNYYCSYVSNAFSLFTALRVVLDEEVHTVPSSTNTTCCIN
ncbi:odorant receptor 13a-like isoform X1 [Megalopta genalis]|uniref:odorant receptor 13a-like isoform X1 n=1 Tax=Megalopta genalis TaxID=115081 RepID=UPI003FD11E60